MDEKKQHEELASPQIDLFAPDNVPPTKPATAIAPVTARMDAELSNEITTQERRIKCLELKKRGYSVRSISQALGITEVQVCNNLRTALANLSKMEEGLSKYLRQLEVERLDMAIAALYPAVAAADQGAIDRWVKLSESRRRLLGLDAPTQVKQEVTTLTREYIGINLPDV